MRPGPTSLGPFDPGYRALPEALPIFPLTGAVLLSQDRDGAILRRRPAQGRRGIVELQLQLLGQARGRQDRAGEPIPPEDV